MAGLAALKESQSVVVNEVPSGSSQSFLGGTRAQQTLPLHKEFAPHAAAAASPLNSSLKSGDGLATLLHASSSSHLKGLLNSNGTAAPSPKGAAKVDGVPLLLQAASLTGSSRLGLLKLQAAQQPADPQRSSPLAAAPKPEPLSSALPAVSPVTASAAPAKPFGPFHGIAGLMQVVPPDSMLGYLGKLARVAQVPQAPNTEFSGLATLLQIASSKRMSLPATEGMAHSVGLPVPPKSESALIGLDLLLGIVKHSLLPFYNLRCLGAVGGHALCPLQGPPGGTAMAALLLAAGKDGLRQMGGLQLLSSVKSTGMTTLLHAARQPSPEAASGLQMVAALHSGKAQAPAKVAPSAEKKPSGSIPVTLHVLAAGYLSWQSGKPESPVLAQRKGMIDIAPHVAFVGYLKL
eukprot:GGOE01065235.1.p1 GENE.GGOE01065235.1~~GGOE01065235.1.p1  ORF type:complete len:439 (-),score=149.43 GGOE01065235.1:223-1437(-)